MQSLFEIRNTRLTDVPRIADLSRTVYPHDPYEESELASQVATFPNGHFVAAQGNTIVGMSACLMIRDADYDLLDSWNVMTCDGTIRNHNPATGDVLYSVDTFVSPSARGHGIAAALLSKRIELARRLGIRVIRGGTRLVGYQRFADGLSAQQYASRVLSGQIRDAALSFILRFGYRLRAVAPEYLSTDPECCGCAAIMEYLVTLAPDSNDEGPFNEPA